MPALGLASGLIVALWSAFIWSDGPVAIVLTLGSLLILAGLFNLALYLVGFVHLSRNCDNRSKHHHMGVGRCGEDRGRPKSPSVAIVMAVFHEDAESVKTALRQMRISLGGTTLLPHSDFFLLSDSIDPRVRANEDRVHRELAAEFGFSSDQGWVPASERTVSGQIFLIRRSERRNFKAGNIAHFVEKHGWAYDYMIVLDADSLILGRRIEQMIARMEYNPQLGILQSTIKPIGSLTLFARSMGYSISRCLPIFAAGLARVFGGQCVYWGHNAVIRLEAFREHGNLPVMPGKPPLGGAILSHDIVEAALLGRAGYSVEWDIEATGSYDGVPEDVLSYGRRDRRWCQGNFQHFWLTFGDGIRPWHRLYFANGILSYWIGPLILVLALAGFAKAAQQPPPPSQWLFGTPLLSSFVLVIGLPKALALVRLIQARRSLAVSKHPRGWRPIREFASTIVELGLSILMAPMLFYLHLRFVVEILLGQVVTWAPQRRSADSAIPWRAAVDAFWAPTLLGILWLAAAVQAAPQVLASLWLILAGWIFSIPLAVITSSPVVGKFATRCGLFESCFENSEAEELASLEAYSKPAEPGGRLTTTRCERRIYGETR